MADIIRVKSGETYPLQQGDILLHLPLLGVDIDSVSDPTNWGVYDTIRNTDTGDTYPLHVKHLDKLRVGYEIVKNTTHPLVIAKGGSWSHSIWYVYFTMEMVPLVENYVPLYSLPGIPQYGKFFYAVGIVPPNTDGDLTIQAQYASRSYFPVVSVVSGTVTQGVYSVGSTDVLALSLVNQYYFNSTTSSQVLLAVDMVISGTGGVFEVV